MSIDDQNIRNKIYFDLLCKLLSLVENNIRFANEKLMNKILENLIDI